MSVVSEGLSNFLKYLIVFSTLEINTFSLVSRIRDMALLDQPNIHTIFKKMYHFIFHFMSSLVTRNVVILVLIILKTHVLLRDF